MFEYNFIGSCLDTILISSVYRGRLDSLTVHILTDLLTCRKAKCGYKNSIISSTNPVPNFNKLYHFFTTTLYIQYESLKLPKMKLDKSILKNCQGLVTNCNYMALILDVQGEHRAFLVNDVHIKTREYRYNEVRDIQDITILVLNVGHNFANGMTQ